MKGCRPLSDQEVDQVLLALADTHFAERNQALFVVGLKTGFRISELLSLRIKDVFKDGRIVEEITVSKQNMKGKKEGRSVPFHSERARALLQCWLAKLGTDDLDRVLFATRMRSKKAMDRITAWKMLKKAYAQAGIGGKVATHTMRKTFARDVKRLVNDDLLAVQKALGHRQLETTTRYLESDDDKLKEAFRKL